MFEIKPSSDYRDTHCITCSSTDQEILVSAGDLEALKDAITHYLYELDLRENEMKLQGVNYD